MRRAMALLALFAACTVTPQTRQSIAQDIDDALTVAAPLLGESAKPYLDAVLVITKTLREDPDGEVDWADLARLVEEAKPLARQGLLDAGWDEARIDSVLALVTILVRRVVPPDS